MLSKGAQTLAFVRRMHAGETMLVDPVEVADQARAGSGEFNCGWWDIRTQLREPARQRMELPEGRFPRARRHEIQEASRERGLSTPCLVPGGAGNHFRPVLRIATRRSLAG